MIVTVIYVALGGALGSVLRVLLGTTASFPFGTLWVNILGSFLIGAAWVSGLDKSSGIYPFFILGILGGFTTFSTFSLDALKLTQAGQPVAAASYVLGSVALSLLAVGLGAWVAGQLP